MVSNWHVRTLCTWCKPLTPGGYVYNVHGHNHRESSESAQQHCHPQRVGLNTTIHHLCAHPHTLLWVECHSRWDHPDWIKGLRSWEGRPSWWRGNWVRREGTISECTNWEEHSRNGDKQLLPQTNTQTWITSDNQTNSTLRVNSDSHIYYNTHTHAHAHAHAHTPLHTHTLVLSDTVCVIPHSRQVRVRWS